MMAFSTIPAVGKQAVTASQPIGGQLRLGYGEERGDGGNYLAF